RLPLRSILFPYTTLFRSGMSGFKYGACNLATPLKLGTLEFRFLRPIIDPERLKFWVHLLNQMVQTSARIPVSESLSWAYSESASDRKSTRLNSSHVKSSY